MLRDTTNKSHKQNGRPEERPSRYAWTLGPYYGATTVPIDWQVAAVAEVNVIR